MKNVLRIFALLAVLLAGCASADLQKAPLFDEKQAIEDVRELSSPKLEGRKTSTPGSKLARAYLVERFKVIGLAPLGNEYSHPFSFKLRSGQAFDDAANLIGVIQGKEQPDRWLLISAHHDHLGVADGKLHPGADDNASGVAAMLAIAAHFKSNPPQHSMMFVAFDAEEQGLRGARQFVDNPPLPLANIAAMLNMDMVSANIRNEIYMAGTWHRPWLKPYIDEAAARASVKVLFGHDQPRTTGTKLEDWTISSDHGPFHMKGIPFVYFGVEDHPHYHQPTDTFENFNREFFLRAVPLFIDVAKVLDRELSEIAKKAGR